MGRTVTLVLVDAAGRLRGALPPMRLAAPHWPETADVVAAARERHGVEVDVLRMLHADRPAPPGGHLTLLAEIRTPSPPAPQASDVDPAGFDLTWHPRRAPWAVPGGPTASVRWAVGVLAGPAGAAVRAVQQRSWNLSAVWRLDVRGHPVAWLKQVPDFFAHEATVLRLLADVAPGLAPRLLAAGPHHRHLLAHVPGADRYGAGADVRADIAADWHPVQARLAAGAADLVAAGVPDRRQLVDRLAAVTRAHRHTVTGLGELVDGLPERMAAVAACGLPDTLVHGDLHPGNVRTDGTRRVILDWGDACVGHPAYDILRLVDDLPAHGARQLVDAWARRWRAAVPGSDPHRAATLLWPVAALSAAAQYADFLRLVEPAEWPYHALDVVDRLSVAVARTRAAADTGSVDIGLTP